MLSFHLLSRAVSVLQVSSAEFCMHF